MFSHISERITENMIKSGAVVSDDKELYLFGVHQGLMILLNIGTTVAVGLLLGVLWQILLFMAAYVPLRSFAGGYHAKTPLRCYILSVLMLVAVSLILKYSVLHIFVCMGLLITASIVIIALSPVGNENKPLDEAEKRVYRRKTMNILTIEILGTVVFMCLNLMPLAKSIIWAVITVCIMLLTGKAVIIFFPKMKK